MNSPVHAAQYIRMSTDVQDLSLDTQKIAIGEYASAHAIDVITTYEDAGRSGLTLANRPAMRRLLDDVAKRDCPFTIVLVYDVSRWGRFQDTDASAYYEYHCRLHGVSVVYVQELFASADGTVATLLKGLKRAMAAEYSRELGVKARAGQQRAIERGFQMGLLPPLGYRRMAVSREGTAIRELAAGERKPSPTDRIRWVLGPEQEVGLVKEIFDLYVNTNVTMAGIARLLSRTGLRTRTGASFKENHIADLLRNEAYIGTFVWGRRGQEPGAKLRSIGDAGLSRVEGAIPPIVALQTWKLAVQKRIANNRMRNRNLIQDLKRALEDNPSLNGVLLPGYGCASPSTYKRAFGSYEEARRLAGIDEAQAQQHWRQKQADSARLSGRVAADLEHLLIGAGMSCRSVGRERVLVIEHKLRIKIQLVWSCRRGTQTDWVFRRTGANPFDFALIARMLANETALDFVLVTSDVYFRTPWLLSKRPEQGETLVAADDVVGAMRRLLLLQR